MYTKCIYTKHNRNHRVIHHLYFTYYNIHYAHYICVYRYIYANFQDFEAILEISKIFADIDEKVKEQGERNTC